MGEGLTRDELKMMLEVQSKNVEQLTIIAKSLQDIVAREEKIQARLYNGMGKEIAETVIKEMKECNSDCASHHKTLLEGQKTSGNEHKIIVESLNFIKWTIVSLFGLVTIAALIIKVVNNG
jgi:hypothetical protein